MVCNVRRDGWMLCWDYRCVFSLVHGVAVVNCAEGVVFLTKWYEVHLDILLVNRCEEAFVAGF